MELRLFRRTCIAFCAVRAFCVWTAEEDAPKGPDSTHLIGAVPPALLALLPPQKPPALLAAKLAKLAHAIDHGKGAEPLRAVRMLGRTSSDAALPHLVKVMWRGNPLLRSSSFAALSEMENEGATRVLAWILKNGDAKMAGAAARALGEHRQDLALPALVDALASPGEDVVLASIKSLGALGDNGAIPALEKAARQVGSEVATYAIIALAHIDTSEAASAMAKLLTDREERTRVAVLWAMGTMTVPDVVPHLQAAMGHKSERVRQAAAAACGCATQVQCQANLKVIALALNAYRRDHDGRYPDRLEQLLGKYLANEEALTCPSHKLLGATGGYEYLGPRPEAAKLATPLVRDARPANHSGVTNALFEDGRVVRIVARGRRP